MKLLDLFCGEGGAGMGYHLAGFEVVGVDNAPARLKRYPFESHRGDALEFLAEHGHEFDAIHASPPCTGYSRGTAALPDRLDRYDRLIPATRDLLEQTGKPWVWPAGECYHPRDMQCAGAYGGARRDKWEAKHVRKGGYVPSVEVMRQLLGTPWMSEKGCQLSIPPAYAQWIGGQLLGHLGERVA